MRGPPTAYAHFACLEYDFLDELSQMSPNNQKQTPYEIQNKCRGLGRCDCLVDQVATPGEEMLCRAEFLGLSPINERASSNRQSLHAQPYRLALMTMLQSQRHSAKDLDGRCVSICVIIR